MSLGTSRALLCFIINVSSILGYEGGFTMFSLATMDRGFMHLPFTFARGNWFAS
jgi:hypothetical protein